MTMKKALISAAVVTAVSATGFVVASTDKADAAKKDREKCYGIVKKGANDCGTSMHSCAGHAKMDRAGDEWVYVPKGLCERIAGSSLKPKS